MCILSITAESGMGKSTMAEELLKCDERMYLVRSFTTRAKRETDLPGEYEYVELETFMRMREQAEFLWDVQHGDQWYGTKEEDVRSAISDMTRIGIMILVPNVLEPLLQFLERINANQDDWLACYIQPMSDDQVMARLVKRGESDANIKKRMVAERGWSETVWRFHMKRKPVKLFRNSGPIPLGVQNVIRLLGSSTSC